MEPLYYLSLSFLKEQKKIERTVLLLNFRRLDNIFLYYAVNGVIYLVREVVKVK